MGTDAALEATFKDEAALEAALDAGPSTQRMQGRSERFSQIFDCTPQKASPPWEQESTGQIWLKTLEEERLLEEDVTPHTAAQRTSVREQPWNCPQNPLTQQYPRSDRALLAEEVGVQRTENLSYPHVPLRRHAGA